MRRRWRHCLAEPSTQGEIFFRNSQHLGELNNLQKIKTLDSVTHVKICVVRKKSKNIGQKKSIKRNVGDGKIQFILNIQS